MKREWGFLGFWIAVAALAVTGGLGLSSLEHPVAGRRLFYTGLLLGALLAFGELARWAVGGVKSVSNPVLRTAQGIARFLVDAVVWFGVLLFAPVIRRALNRADYPESVPQTWTACQKRGKQGSDFFPITREGYRVAGARFTVRPDRPLPHWHAGFRLTTRNEDIVNADLLSTVLVQFSGDYFGGQQEGHACAREGNQYGPWAFAAANLQPPSRTFDVSVSRHPVHANLLQVNYQIDGQPSQTLEFRREYGEQIVLIAWAGG